MSGIGFLIWHRVKSKKAKLGYKDDELDRFNSELNFSWSALDNGDICWSTTYIHARGIHMHERQPDSNGRIKASFKQIKTGRLYQLSDQVDRQ